MVGGELARCRPTKGTSGGAQEVRCQPEQLPVQAEQQLLADDAPTTALHSPVSMALLPPLPPLTM